MASSFILRANERGFNKLLSTGPNASYIAGHPGCFHHSAFELQFPRIPVRTSGVRPNPRVW